MGALKTTAAAALLAGIVGIGLYVVWALDYEYGLVGVFFSFSNPLTFVAAYGLVWGPLLLLSGIGLLAVAIETAPISS